VLDQPVAEQNGFLKNALPDDEPLRLEVASLLEFQGENENFIETSALEVTARALAETQEEMAGKQIGPFLVEREIGRGGMGAVYLARQNDNHYQRQVAIKVIKRGMDSDEIVRRFRNERQILANLTHPNIAGLYSGGTTDAGLPFFVMEYVAGEPICKYCEAQDLSTKERLKLFRVVCSAISYAHQNLVIHRDLKPSNILVTEDRVPKLLDFGIAKLLKPDEETAVTESILRVMTPEYASPEQARGEIMTTASDVYSLGVLLYELLTGRRPYRLQNRLPHEIAQIISERVPERPSTAISRVEEIPEGPTAPESIGTTQSHGKARSGELARLRRNLRGDLDNIVLTAMRKDPARRYQSVEQFSEDIGRHLDGLPVHARKDTFGYRSSKFVQRNKLAVAAAAIITITLLGGVIATIREARIAHAERARAERRFNDVRKLTNSFMFEFHDAIQDLPGSLKARQLVVQKALTYLDGLAQEASDDRSLQSELAVSYDKIGNLTFDVDRSLEIHLKALALNEALVKAEPANQTYREQLAVSYGSVADLSRQGGDTARALENREKARTVMEALATAEPANLRYRSLLVDNYEDMSSTLSETGQKTTAMEYGRKALLMREALAAGDPGNAEHSFSLVVDYLLVGGILLDLGDNAGALENYRKGLAVSESLLASDPGSSRYRRHMWASQSRVANALMRLGDLKGALAEYQKALLFIEALVAADPDDKGHAHGLSVTYVEIGNLLSQMARTSAAQENYRKALAISENLLASDPSKAETRLDLGRIYLGFGNVLTTVGDTTRARDYLRKGQEFFSAAIRSDPKAITPKEGLAKTYAGIGKLYAGLALSARSASRDQNEKWQAARSNYQKSFDIWQELNSSGRLTGVQTGKPDEITRDIAKCDAALSTGR